MLAARAHLPSLVEAQPCHTDTSGLKVGVVVAAFLFVFFRWKGGSGLDSRVGSLFSPTRLDQGWIVGSLYLSSIIGVPCSWGLGNSNLCSHGLGVIAAEMVFVPVLVFFAVVSDFREGAWISLIKSDTPCLGGGMALFVCDIRSNKNVPRGCDPRKKNWRFVCVLFFVVVRAATSVQFDLGKDLGSFGSRKLGHLFSGIANVVFPGVFPLFCGGDVCYGNYKHSRNCHFALL